MTVPRLSRLLNLHLIKLPDEVVLDYSYQVLEAGGAHYDECDYNFQVEAPGQQGLFG